MGRLRWYYSVKTNKMLAAVMGLVVSGFILAFAQTSSSPLQLLEEFPPLDLPLAAPEVAFESGNFFSAANPDWPPMPGVPRARQGLPIYSLAAELGQPSSAPFFLVDDRAYTALREAMAAGLLSSEMMNSLELPPFDEGEGGGEWTNSLQMTVTILPLKFAIRRGCS